MVDRLAVNNGASACRVVSHHPAQCRPAAAGSVRPEQESFGPQVGIEYILYETWLEPHPSLFRVEFQHVMHVFGEVQMNGVPDGLPRQACASSSRQYG